MEAEDLLKKIITKIPFKILTNEGLIIIILLAYGIIGSYFIMNLSILDSVYYALITMATIGYGDITPVTTVQKVFTITLAVGGLGIIAYVFTIILSNFSEKMNKVAKGAKIMRKIEKMDDYVVICGYGRVGKTIVKNMNERNQNVIIIEKDPLKTEKVKDLKNIAVLKRDATEEDVLKYVLTEKCNSIVICTGDDVTNLFIVLSIREIDKDVLIVSRLSNIENKNKLIQAGANKIVSPEIIGGEDIFYNAIEKQMIKVTTKYGPEKLVETAEKLEELGCRIESIDFHLRGIKTPLSHKIESFEHEDITKLKKIVEKDEFDALYKLSNSIHSEWITCPNKKSHDILIEKLEQEDDVLGINLTNHEIQEIIKKRE